jgi:hypothetical protein
MQGAVPGYERAELVIALPPDWPLAMQDFEDERNWWPLRLLQNLAHMPQNTGGWIGFGHVIPHGHPPQTYADNTSLCGAVLLPPVLTPPRFSTLTHEDETVHFLGVYTLNREELQYAQDAGGQVMFERLAEGQVTEQVDLARASVV